MTPGHIHIHAPRPTDKTCRAATCPDCKKRTRMLSFFTPWYGWDSTCLRCGRHWSDGEWMDLDFVRGARAKSIAAAKRRWRTMPAESIDKPYFMKAMQDTKENDQWTK